MSIVAERKIRNSLSGKYNFHSMKNNIPAFMREGGKISGIMGENYYLVFHEPWKTWHITENDQFSKGQGGGYFANISSG